MQLGSLLENIPFTLKQGSLDVEVNGLSYDSRQIDTGDLFTCIKGLQSDGHRFASQAVTKGCSAILCQDPLPSLADQGVAVITTPDSRAALAQVACAFYNHPASEMNIVGITGTNGKTTTSFLLESVFHSANLQSGVMGTINYRYAGKTLPAKHTTPEACDIQKILRSMADSNVSHVAMEVSSHGLEQHRTDGCRLRGAILTNITQDHLDYHQDMDTYTRAKLKIFDLLDAKGFALIFGDPPNLKTIAKRLKHDASYRVVTFGFDNDNDFQITNCHFSQGGIEFELVYAGTSLEINSHLNGHHNALNCACVAASGILLDLPNNVVAQGIASLRNVPGRLERISSTHGVHTFVDYAHTSDAITNVTAALNKMRAAGGGKLITVVGCGGDRDRQKRPLMGLAATNASDITIFTSDNPRTEDPQQIIDDIVKPPAIQDILVDQIEPGKTAKTAMIEVDRKKAIQLALSIATPNDFVLVAGQRT